MNPFHSIFRRTLNVMFAPVTVSHRMDSQQFAALLQAIDRNPPAVSIQLALIRKELKKMDSRIQEQLDALIADVAAQTTVIESASAHIDAQEVILADVQAQLEAALAGQNIDVEAVLQPLTDARAAITASKEKLATAMLANTPEAPTEPTGTPAE